jgi:hypothetical protein
MADRRLTHGGIAEFDLLRVKHVFTPNSRTKQDTAVESYPEEHVVYATICRVRALLS